MAGGLEVARDPLDEPGIAVLAVADKDLHRWTPAEAARPRLKADSGIVIRQPRCTAASSLESRGIVAQACRACARSSGSIARKGLVEIGMEVLRILEPDRQAKNIGRAWGTRAFDRGAMLDQAL